MCELDELGGEITLSDKSSDKDHVSCDICGRRFLYWGLNDHIKAKHGKTVPCEICGRKFLTEGGVMQHKESVHSHLL